jgi:citrate synthase
MIATATGLEGVLVAETELSEVDGAKGRLCLRGHDVEALAGSAPFETVVGLFLDGDLASGVELERTRRDLGAARAAAFRIVESGALGDALRAPDAMDALRAGVAHLSDVVPVRDAAGAAAHGHAGDRAAGRDASVRVIAAVAVFAAAWSRRNAGLDPVAPDPSRAHAADYLAMIHGAPPPASHAAALDAYLATVVDHGLNASTFTARVVASTGSDRVSAIVAAIGALKGPLHGGAPGPVLDMLDAVGDAGGARAWLERELAEGRRIMGMGHRVYRVRDPRAAVLESALRRLGGGEPDRDEAHARLELARAVEREAEALLAARHPDRPLRANVEFFTAVLLEAVGLPRTLFSATFAVARTVGWCAHYAEQRRVGRLIRPSSRYVGPRPDSTAQPGSGGAEPSAPSPSAGARGA